jgi:hypothetical protein
MFITRTARTALTTLAFLSLFASPSMASSGLIHDFLASETKATLGNFRGIGCNDALTELLPDLGVSDTFQYRFAVKAGGRSYIRTMCLFSVEDGAVDFVGSFAEDTTDGKVPESCIGLVGLKETSDTGYQMVALYKEDGFEGKCPVKGQNFSTMLNGYGSLNRVGGAR